MRISKDDTILLLDLKDTAKRYLVDVAKGEFSTKRGQIDLTALVGKEYGTIIETHLGAGYVVLKPTLYDRIMHGVRRQTQIVYPKDAGYIALWLGLTNSMRIFECGTGSGAMTAIIANAVAPNGKVISYEKDERFFELAQKNLDRLGFSQYVELHLRDLADGIEGAPYDAAFIDVREPWLYLEQVWNALAGGAPIAFVVPTTNQVQMLLQSLDAHDKFIDIRVAETMMRFYKAVAERLRPEDRMVAHTTYIIMARQYDSQVG